MLSDEDKRRKCDRDLVGTEQTARAAEPAGAAFDDRLDSFFGTRAKRERAGAEPSFLRGGDLFQSLRIGFAEAALGTRKRLVLGEHRVVEVAVPAGALDGMTLRLKGQGTPGRFGRPAGDMLVEITVDAHPNLTRRGTDIHLTLPITVPEAVQGATVTVPTVHGPVQLKVPRGSNTDSVLRLKGKGIPLPDGGTGDQYVTLKVVLPPGEDTEFSKIVEQWGRRRSYVVR